MYYPCLIMCDSFVDMYLTWKPTSIVNISNYLHYTEYLEYE